MVFGFQLNALIFLERDPVSYQRLRDTVTTSGDMFPIKGRFPYDTAHVLRSPCPLVSATLFSSAFFLLFPRPISAPSRNPPSTVRRTVPFDALFTVPRRKVLASTEPITAPGLIARPLHTDRDLKFYRKGTLRRNGS